MLLTIYMQVDEAKHRNEPRAQVRLLKGMRFPALILTIHNIMASIPQQISVTISQNSYSGTFNDEDLTKLMCIGIQRMDTLFAM